MSLPPIPKNAVYIGSEYSEDDEVVSADLRAHMVELRAAGKRIVERRIVRGYETETMYFYI